MRRRRASAGWVPPASCCVDSPEMAVGYSPGLPAEGRAVSNGGAQPVRGNRNVGADRLIEAEDRLIIISGSEMPDFQVRRYRRTAVLVDGRRYFVASRELGDRRRIRCVLEPWPDTLTDLPGRTIVYDEAFVAARDGSKSRDTFLLCIHHVLVPLQPVIGFLPSGIKLWLEDRYGIPARPGTFVSIYAEMLAFLALGVLAWIGAYGGMRTAALTHQFEPTTSLIWFVGVALFLLVDLIVRYGSHLRGDRSPYGFGEWVFRRPPRAE